MVKTIKKHVFTVLPKLVKALSISIRHEPVSRSMHNESRAIIGCSSLIYRQRKGSYDVIATQFLAFKEFNRLRRIKRIAAFSKRTAADCVFSYHAGRCHQCHRSNLLAAQFACQHTRNDATLRMSRHRNSIHIRQCCNIIIHLLGIFYLVQHGHFREISLALSMPIEIETNRSNAMSLQRIGNQFVQLTTLVAHKTVQYHHHRALLTCRKHRFLNNSS